MGIEAEASQRQAALEMALHQALDRMETAWQRINPEPTPDDKQAVAQALWFGMEELRALLDPVEP